MKNSIFLIRVFSLLIYCIACNAHKNLFQLPVEMHQSVRTEYTKICEQGQLLFEMYCIKCHRVNHKGNFVVPDFQPAQLESHRIRWASSEHMKQINEDVVTAEQLAKIITFLTYKKRCGVEFQGNTK